MEKEVASDDITLLIIGNGFDLNCGLRSSYPDYYNYFLKHKYNGNTIINGEIDLLSAKRSNEENCFNKYIIRAIDNIHNFTGKIKKEDIITNNFWEEAVYLYKTIYSHHLQNSKLGNTDANSLNIENWENFEFLIESVLKEISSIVPLDNLFEGAAAAIVKKSFSADNIGLALFYLAYYTWSSNNEDKTAESIVDYLERELTEFEKDFAKYLRNAVSDNDIYNNKRKQLLRKLADNLPIYFISFNYTIFPENIILDVSSINGINIHGDYDHTPVMGIDQTTKDIDPNVYRFTKSYKIMSFANQTSSSSGIPQSISSIVFYGHSLGEADYSYFQSIFDFYDLYHSSVKVYFKYSIYDSNKKDEITRKQYDAVYNLFFHYGNSFSNSQHGRNLMTKLLLEHRLFIEELPELSKNDGKE